MILRTLGLPLDKLEATNSPRILTQQVTTHDWRGVRNRLPILACSKSLPADGEVAFAIRQVPERQVL